MFNLQPLRHISTLPRATKLLCGTTRQRQQNDALGQLVTGIGHRPHRHIGPLVDLPLRVTPAARATASSTRDQRFAIANQTSNARETRGKSYQPLAASGR